MDDKETDVKEMNDRGDESKNDALLDIVIAALLMAVFGAFLGSAKFLFQF